MKRTLIVLAALGLMVLGMNPASAAAPVDVKIRETYQLDEQGNVVLRWVFTPKVVTVPSGGYVRFDNVARNEEPHTASVVRAAEVPDTIEEVFGCFTPGEVCFDFFLRHEPPNGDPRRVVNAGAPGFNIAGDSRFIVPDQALNVKVTAPAGATLRYICAIHPWMNGTIRVV